MARTTTDNVRELLQRDYDKKSNPNLAPYIDTASLVVDRIESAAIDASTIYSDPLLEMLERWLAAHFYVQADPSYSSRSSLGASGSFTGSFGMGLDNSRYGQQVRMLDYRKIIDSIESEATEIEASGDWGGTDFDKV